MTNDRWKETWKNKHLCFKWQMTAERKHKKTNTCASNDKWPLKGNIKKQTPVLQTTNNCWTETWKNTLEKLKVLYTRKCKRLGITYDVQICCICSENHETGHFLHHWEMTFWAYSVLALYKAHQLMRSTKVQTLGVLRVRGTANWWADGYEYIPLQCEGRHTWFNTRWLKGLTLIFSLCWGLLFSESVEKGDGSCSPFFRIKNW